MRPSRILSTAPDRLPILIETFHFDLNDVEWLRNHARVSNCISLEISWEEPFKVPTINLNYFLKEEQK